MIGGDRTDYRQPWPDLGPDPIEARFMLPDGTISAEARPWVELLAHLDVSGLELVAHLTSSAAASPAGHGLGGDELPDLGGREAELLHQLAHGRRAAWDELVELWDREGVNQ